MYVDWTPELCQAGERLMLGLTRIGANEPNEGEQQRICRMLEALANHNEIVFFAHLLNGSDVEQLLWQQYAPEIQLMLGHLQSEIVPARLANMPTQPVQSPPEDIPIHTVLQRNATASVSQHSRDRSPGRSSLSSEVDDSEYVPRLEQEVFADESISDEDSSAEVYRSRQPPENADITTLRSQIDSSPLIWRVGPSFPRACFWCPEHLQDQQALDQHLLISSLCKSYSKNYCPLCRRHFSQRGTLTQHIQQQHQKVGLHRCPTCEYRCASKSNMNIHRQRCNGGGTQCNICNKVCKTPGGLKLHMRHLHSSQGS